MAKVNTAITAAQNLLALVNTANPALNLTEAQANIGAPVAVAGTAGRNTTVTYTAVDNQGFSGVQTFAYTRQALAAGAAIATAKAVPVSVVQGDTDAQILTKVAAALGLMESELTIDSVVAPVDEDTTGLANVVAKADSLLYTGTYEVTLSVPDADVHLSEAAPVTDLDGFDAEA